MRGIWRRENGGGGLPAPLSVVSTGRDVVRSSVGTRPAVSGLAFACRPLLSPPASGCGHSDRLPRISLVAGAAGSFSWHPRFLFRAASALGMGRLARQEDAPLGESRLVRL